jgi:hypothetical protein
MARRNSDAAGRFARKASGFPGTGASVPRQIYFLGILLLLLVFFMLTFRGQVPRAVERAFAPPQSADVDVSKRREELAKEHGGAWLEVRDGTGFVETPGYGRLLYTLIDHVRPGDIVADPPLLDRELAIRAPDLQRSEVVKVRGIAADVRAVKLDTPIFQLHDVWRIFITTVSADDAVVVDVAERPPKIEARRDVVEFTGTFYRLVGYEGQKGDHREIPYLLARSIRVVPEERDTSSWLDDPARAVLMLALAAMIVWGVLRVAHARSRTPSVRWRAPHLR